MGVSTTTDDAIAASARLVMTGWRCSTGRLVCLLGSKRPGGLQSLTVQCYCLQWVEANIGAAWFGTLLILFGRLALTCPFQQAFREACSASVLQALGNVRRVVI